MHGQPFRCDIHLFSEAMGNLLDYSGCTYACQSHRTLYRSHHIDFCQSLWREGGHTQFHRLEALCGIHSRFQVQPQFQHVLLTQGTFLLNVLSFPLVLISFNFPLYMLLACLKAGSWKTKSPKLLKLAFNWKNRAFDNWHQWSNQDILDL